jgi:TolA-binding protein
MIKKLTFACLITAVLGLHPLMAQKNYWFETSEPEFNKAMELFKQEKYGSARLAFEAFEKNHQQETTNLVPEAAFLEARCSQLLLNSDASTLYEKFIHRFPESNKVAYCQYHLGEILANNGKYKPASRWFDKVDDNALDLQTRYALWFNRGYCLFMIDDYDQAITWFLKIKDLDTPYHLPSTYYYSHIQYAKGNYDTALKGFLKLEKEPAFEEIVPFYIAQIYYLQKEYDKAIAYATPLLTTGTENRQADMNRIVGNAWFAKKEYAKATPFFEKAIALTTSPTREDYYHLGFCYYFTKKYDKSSTNLSRVTAENDSLSQNAYYHLADCYLKMRDKKRARVAFEAASKCSFDPAIQEDAMLNYLKLNYELAYSPFNEIINSFMKFIEMFPNSTRIDQAYDYLGKAFLTTKNYKQALASMERIKKKDTNVYKAMQRIAYYRGLELFTALQFTEANTFFTQSLKYGEYDKDLKVKALYWRGESYYRLRDFDKASVDYNAFILAPASFRLPEFKTAHYNMGYICFNTKNYNESQSWFRKYLNLVGNEQSPMVADACNRTGDCLFVDRDFNGAISYYQKSAQIKSVTPDYAVYQQAFCLGLMKKHNEKINMLNQLTRQYPTSPYVDDAYYEIGRSYVAMNNLPSAITSYKTVRDKYPQSSFANKALLQLGLVYYNSNDLDNSLVFYKRVINEYPGTPEAEEALLGVRNVYMERSDPNGYIKYANTLGGFAQADVRQQDSLIYETAQRFYQQEQCERAVPNFESYLSSFPEGRFALEAHFCKADCQYQMAQYAGALKSYEWIANRGRNNYTEEALLRAGEICYMQNNYDNALKYFTQLEEAAEMADNKLEARIGQMRCMVKQGNNPGIVSAASKVLWSPKLAPEIEREARLAKAKVLVASGDFTAALPELKKLATNTASAEGAESKYIICQYYYDINNDNAAEKEVFDFADMGSSQPYWLARSFIVLSDVYLRRGETFQAQQYLQSILENYEGNDDIRPTVNERLKKIKAQAPADSSNEQKIKL